MRSLKELRFSSGPALPSLTVTLDDNELSLPSEYLAFLGCEPPQKVEFGFKFLRADTNEQCEGQVVEFMRYQQNTVDAAVVSHPSDPGRKFLPIAVDAGGNYLHLDLTTSPMRVVDVCYQGGAISPVAESFGEFINMLYAVDE